MMAAWVAHVCSSYVVTELCREASEGEKFAKQKTPIGKSTLL